MRSGPSIPKGWSMITLEEMVESTALGTSVRGTDGKKNIRLVKMGNLLWGGFNLEGAELVASDLVDNVDDLMLQQGDFLFNTRNAAELVGKSGTWSDKLGLAIFDNNILRIRFRPELNPFYLSNWMNNGSGRRAVRSLACGSTSVSAIYWRDLSKLKMPLPPIQEQNRIVEFIGAWDAAIGLLQLILAAKTRRLSWFRSEFLTGKRQLPGYRGKWTAVKLKELLAEHGLKSSGIEEVFSVSVHKGLINQIEHLGRSFAAKRTEHYNRVAPGDIVYTKSPTGDFPLGIIKQSNIEKDVIVSPLYGVFNPKTRQIGAILDCFFEAPTNVSNYLSPLVQKGAKNTIAITNRRFLEGRIAFPSDAKEQEQIAALVATIKAEIDATKKLIASIELQRRGLLQKLLTGEWRVPARDGDVGAMATCVAEEAAQ